MREVFKASDAIVLNPSMNMIRLMIVFQNFLPLDL